MRHKTYVVKQLWNGEVKRIPFTRVDFDAVGIPFAPLGGMPDLEAYQLVNGWNTSQDVQQRMYGLETPQTSIVVQF